MIKMRYLHLTMLASFTTLSTFTFASNPMCNNEDENMVFYYKCYAFSDDQFVQVYKHWPTFDDGTPYEDEGEIFWQSNTVRISRDESEFTKNGIIFKVYPYAAAYNCNYSVFRTDQFNVGDVNFHNYDQEFGVNFYNCGYNREYELSTPDTTFAQTEFQRFISKEDVISALLTRNIDELGPWKIYRKDGTLKFIGDVHGGYCMSNNGMKKTKKVTSAIYCK